MIITGNLSLQIQFNLRPAEGWSKPGKTRRYAANANARRDGRAFLAL
jgi:hypothetical protein